MMGVQTGLVVLVLCAVAMTAQGDSRGDVQFTKNSVTLACPWTPTKWGPKLSNTEKTYTFTYEKPVKLFCEFETEKYFFFVKGKGCDNCFELEGWKLAVAIIGDVVMTTILMMIIYKCTKKKTTAQPAQTVTPSAPPANYPPGPHSRHAPPGQTYEQLNHLTRSGIYSSVHKMG